MNDDDNTENKNQQLDQKKIGLFRMKYAWSVVVSFSHQFSSAWNDQTICNEIWFQKSFVFVSIFAFQFEWI